MALTPSVALHKHSAHRHFSFWFLCQADPNGVAESVLQQCADAQGRFDAAVFAVAGLGHPEMKGKGHVFLFHPCHEQAVSLDHDLGVG